MIKNMLYYGNKKWSKSLDALFKSKKATNTNIKSNIQKLLNKGENVYCLINPYTSEINNKIEIIYDISYDDLMETYYTLMEEV